MNMTRAISFLVAVLAFLFLTAPVTATPFFFSTGDPDRENGDRVTSGECGQVRDRIGRRLRPHWPTSITSATFTGLLTGGTTPANIGEVPRRDLPGVSR